MAVWGSSMGHSDQQFYCETYGDFGVPAFILFNSKGKYVCTSRGGFKTSSTLLNLPDCYVL